MAGLAEALAQVAVNLYVATGTADQNRQAFAEGLYSAIECGSVPGVVLSSAFPPGKS